MHEYYVVCPGGIKTGGPELLHQLVYTINHLGYKATIAYTGPDPTTPDSYKKYVSTNILFNEIPDTDQSVVVVPETSTELLLSFNHAKTVLWWLSVDMYRLRADPLYMITHTSAYTSPFAIFYCLPRCLYNGLHSRSKKAIPRATFHLYQSEYAKEYVMSLGIDSSRLLRLSDYIDDSYLAILNDSDALPPERNNQVLYNPKKGRKFTKQLISAAPNINWIPLKGFSREELLNLMKTSKVYIDFGYHPGKDRLPRESAACGTCVIVGLNGAARFMQDYPLPEWARFEANKKSINSIIDTINCIFDNYQTYAQEEANYRNMISREKDLFVSDTQKFIETIESN